MKGWTALVRPQRMCLSRDNMIESSSHSSFSLICISAQDHLGASAMLCSPNLWPPFTLRSQVTLRMGHLFGMLQCLYNSMILPLVPRGCHIMSSTVEGNLFPRFYKGAKCPDADNSVDWCHFSDYGNQVSTIIGTETLSVINRQWRSLQETRWNMPLLNVLSQTWWLWLWGTTGSPELCISCSWSHCQSRV